MIIAALAFLVSLIPVTALFLYFRNGVLKYSRNIYEHQKLCDKALLSGLFSTIPILLLSGTLDILGNILGARGLPLVVQDFWHKYFVLALVEEVVKGAMFLRLLRKNPDHAFTWLEFVIYMVCVAIGFEVLEAIVYIIGSGPIHMLVRGFTAMHAGFGFIMGYYYGKARVTGNKNFYALALFVPWLMHGLYDFALSDSINTALDGFGIIALLLAAICAVLLIVMIVFVNKAKNNPTYMRPLPKAQV